MANKLGECAGLDGCHTFHMLQGPGNLLVIVIGIHGGRALMPALVICSLESLPKLVLCLGYIMYEVAAVMTLELEPSRYEKPLSETYRAMPPCFQIS